MSSLAGASLLSLSSHAQDICPQTQNDEKHTGNREWKSETFRSVLLEVPTEIAVKLPEQVTVTSFLMGSHSLIQEPTYYRTTFLEGRTQAAGG